MSELLHEVVAKRNRRLPADTLGLPITWVPPYVASELEQQRQRALRELHSIDLLTELLGEP